MNFICLWTLLTTSFYIFFSLSTNFVVKFFSSEFVIFVKWKLIFLPFVPLNHSKCLSIFYPSNDKQYNGQRNFVFCTPLYHIEWRKRLSQAIDFETIILFFFLFPWLALSHAAHRMSCARRRQFAVYTLPRIVWRFFFLFLSFLLHFNFAFLLYISLLVRR